MSADLKEARLLGKRKSVSGEGTVSLAALKWGYAGTYEVRKLVVWPEAEQVTKSESERKWY